VLFSSLPAAVAGALCYLATNTMLVAAIMALASGRPAGRMWWRTHKPVLPYYAALAATGIVLAALWIQTPWLVPCVLLLLAALYYALRNTVALETTTVSSLFRLADILDARDRYTHGHAVRVGEYAERLALALGVPDSRAFLVLLAGRLHDIGKCAVRNEVLLKPGALDEAERAHMCTHPAVGGEMLAAYPFFGEIAADVRGHHERWDGKGYPDGLAGNAIPLGARIIAVVDAWDAMTSSRPYRSALPHEEAIRRLSEGAGTQWEPAIVAAFLSLVAQDSSIGRSAAPIAGCGAPVAVLDRTPRASDGTPLAA
jgi:HD-GYP domain-containing protein (c-di-GMP phosphodiesterase class II)